MPKYKIVQKDTPSQYQEKIISFWDEYLAGTPHKRFEWLMNDNPAGPAIWLLALMGDANDLIGTVSLMPKEIIWNGRTFHGAIMGDLMIHKNHRVFGPTVSLLKNAAKLVNENKLDFIYTIPNLDSVKVVERAGLKNALILHDYIKPVGFNHYFQRYLSSSISKVLSALISPVFHFASKEIFLFSKGSFCETTEIDDSFDVFWNTFCNTFSNITGFHDSKYLKWKYLENPLSSFRILTYRVKKNGPLAGYVIFSSESSGISIYDILSLKPGYTTQMIKKVIRIGRKEKVKAIYLTVPPNSFWQRQLKSFGFFDTKESMQVLWKSISDISLDNWNFFQGDRNI